MSNLVNGWYKCIESNEKNADGSWAWIEGRYYYFKGGRTEDERGTERPAGTFPLFRSSNDSDRWLTACHLIPAVWIDGCPVKLKDGRTGKITTVEEGKYIYIQLDDEYAIPSFVQVTPNEFEVITPEAQAFKKMAEQLRRFNEGLGKFSTLIASVEFPPIAFEIPEVGQLVRDKDDLSVWRVEEVTIDHTCANSELHHYVTLRRMDIIRAPWTSNLMRHETRFLDFWDHYEKWSDDMGFTGMFFNSNGHVHAVYNGYIQITDLNGSCRYKDLDEIRKHVDPNAIEVDATTYCKQDDPAKDWFTGYAICMSNGMDDPESPWTYHITVGKIYRMEKGRFINDNNNLDNCTPEEFKKCFKPVNESFT